MLLHSRQITQSSTDCCNRSDKCKPKRSNRTEPNYNQLSSKNRHAMGCCASDKRDASSTSTSSPSTRRHTTSAMRCICFTLCDTIIVVSPWVFFNLTIASSMFWVEIGSNALVGSSNRSTYTRKSLEWFMCSYKNKYNFHHHIRITLWLMLVLYTNNYTAVLCHFYVKYS